jgi:glutamate racemase
LPVIFLADQAHVPYGPRSLAQVRRFSEAITRYLLDRGCKLIVVACNAASAAALQALRQKFPDTPFVGMEPAVKPAAETTRTGVVGVLATPATFQGALYASVVERFAIGVTLLQHTCPGLVAQIEAGELDAPQTRRILEDALAPMLAQGIDTVVLGCTHYPFVIPIQEIVGPGVGRSILPRRWRRWGVCWRPRADVPGSTCLFPSPDFAPADFSPPRGRWPAPLLPRPLGGGEVFQVHWRRSGFEVIQE